MKNRALLRHTLLTCALVAFNILAASAQDNKPKVSEAEAKAAKAVEAAPDVNAKIAAADAFVKKYPKSSLRQHVADYVAEQVFDLKDPNQKVALAQKALTTFTSESEAAAIKPALIDAYFKLNKFDEAFTEGASFLAKNPENIQILVNLAIVGTEQVKQHNAKYLAQSREYGLKAIDLLEADKKPADLDANAWSEYKAMLPQVYQEMAVLSLIQQKPAEAQGKLEKAVKLNPAEPFNYVLLGSIANDEYQRAADTYKSMPAGKAQADMLVKVNQLLDKVIDLYAHAVALSEGKPAYQQLHDQVLKDLTPYYRYRHNSSTDGMQKLIDGYKVLDMSSKP
jgi:hypothetical protein